MSKQTSPMTMHQRKKFLDEILEGPYSLLQKEQLILGNLEGVDFWKYADPNISYLRMEELRKEMRQKI